MAEDKRSANLKAVEALGLPTPRLQFRWEPIDPPEDHFNWRCHYELVLKLDTYDIRNPNSCKAPGEMAVSLGGTRRDSEQAPFNQHSRTVDTPFRDGAHMRWDSEQLKIEHVYAIWGDKVTPLRPVWREWDAKSNSTSTRTASS